MRRLPILASLLCAHMAMAQEILLDKPMHVGKLTIFQEYKNPKHWYYVPDQISLARKNGVPQFSFLKYAVNQRSKPGESDVDQAEGGGILHCLVELGVPDALKAAATSELQKVDPEATLVGPVIFRSGTFGLITSFNKENGDLAKSLVGTGKAPILEGEKAAVSIRLTKLGAQLLWESFKTKTPDISFTFEMDMEGWRSPYEATLKADFDQIYKHKDFEMAAKGQYMMVQAGFGLKATFDDLKRQGAISLETKGEDKNMDSLVNAAYTQILGMMFEKIDTKPEPMNLMKQNEDNFKNLQDGARKDAAAKDSAAKSATKPATGVPAIPGATPAPAAGGAGDAIAKVIDSAKNPPFSLMATYQMKEVHHSGKYEMSFKKYTASKLCLRFDENIGDLTSYMNDPDVFREANLDDPLFKQREIAVYLDGSNATDFKDYVNFVTVRVRKKHQNGDQTDDSVRIDRDNFTKSANNFKVMYGYKGDVNREKWMEYEYDVVWSFFGGKEIDQGWKSATASGIPVFAPYMRRSIQIDGDLEALKAKGIRLVTLQISFDDPHGDPITKQVTIDVSKGPVSRIIPGISKEGKFAYTYQVTWRKTDGTTITSGPRSNGDDILYCDELPKG